MHGLDVEPLTDIAICCGQSEAFAAAMFASMFSDLRWFIMPKLLLLFIRAIFFLLAVIDKGDEVILFDPSYETYETCIKLAGGIPVRFFWFTEGHLPVCVVFVSTLYYVHSF